MPFLTRENIVTCASMSGSFSDDTIVSRRLILDPEMMGGNFWTAKTAPGTNLTRTASAVLNGYGYTSCGYVGTVGNSSSPGTNYHARYDDTADAWTTKTNPTTNTVSPASWTIDGRYYRFQGLISTTSGINSGGEQYNDSSNAWTTINPTGATSAYDQTLSVTSNGLGFVVGGFNFATGALATVQYYNTATNAMNSVTGITATGRQGGFRLGGFVQMVGGINNGGTYLTASSRFNHLANAWTANASLTTARDFPGSFALAELGYVVAGLTTGAVAEPSTEEYNNDANVFLVRANVPTSTAAPTQFAINSNGYLFGGTASIAHQYRNTTWYTVPGILKQTPLKTLTKVVVSASIQGRAITLPVRIRTDGTNWQYMEANTDSIVKFGQVLTTVLAAATGRDYQLQIGIPRWNAGVGGGVWTNLATPTGKQGAASGSAAGFGYHQMGVLGAGPTLQNTNNQYNDWLNVWNTRTAGGAGQTYRDVAGYSLYGMILNAGGADNTPTYQTAHYRFDDATNAWTSLTAVTTARSSAAGFGLNGKGYVIGGRDGGGSKTTNEQYNDSTNAWASKTAVTNARRGAGGFAANGLGYICAGHDGTSTAATAYQYDDNNNAWTTKTALTTAREGVGTFVINSAGYVIDGVDAGTYKSEMQQFSDTANLWTTKAVDPFGIRAFISAFGMNGAGFIAGGVNGAAGNEQSDARRYSLSDQQVVLAVAIRVDEV